MGQQIVIYRYDTEGHRAAENHKVIQRRDYDQQFELELSLLAGIRTDVPVPSGFTIEQIYLEADDGVLVRVYKGRSPEYWEVDRLFFIMDSSVENLALQAATATTVYLWLGGS